MDKEITFRFEKDPEYRVVAVNGAWGGITPRREVKFDLFFEQVDLPDEIIYMTTPDGLGPEISRVPQTTLVTRQVLVGVVMTLENAEGLGHWLLEQVDQCKKRGVSETDEGKAK